MNIAFISSQGGHSGQIKLIFTPDVVGENNAIFITEKPGKDLAPKPNSFHGKFTTYYFPKDKLGFNAYRYLSTTKKLMKIFRKEHIDLIITNGAQLSISAVLAARLLGIRSIFMDTVIRVKTPNWSARACYPLVDLFLVQHPEMKKKYGKKAQYHGGVI